MCVHSTMRKGIFSWAATRAAQAHSPGTLDSLSTCTDLRLVLQVPAHLLREPGCAGAAALVDGQRPAFAIDLRYGLLKPAGLLAVAAIFKHERARKEHRSGVDGILAGKIWRGSVHRLEVSVTFAQAGTRRKPEAADSAGSGVSENIAMLIGEHHHVQCLRGRNHTPRQVVDQKLLVAQGGISPHRLAYQFTKTAIGAGQDRILGSERNAARIALLLALQRQFAGGKRHAPHLLIGDDA